jgi:hypothetical protein
MAITINLKPYPAPAYFTVKDHQCTFKTLDQYDIDGAYDRIVATLRLLHGIPADFSTISILEGQKPEIRRRFKNQIIKDNPATGINELAEANGEILARSLLDLSYSFPLTAANPNAFEAIFVDPRASLGIPVEASFLFTRTGFEGITTSALLPAELHLLDNVLLDIESKGMEMIVREINYKAAVLYQLLEGSQHLAPSVDKKICSKTMISARCDRSFAEKIVKMGYSVEISGGGSDTTIIIANYATHSKEMIELFSDRIMGI